MKKPKISAVRTTVKKSQQDQILDRLFDYFSKPKGQKPSSDSDVEVSFYRSKLTALPRNFYNQAYSGINIIMLLQDQEETSTKVPIYATFKQVESLDLDHEEKPLKGIKFDAQVAKYIETYKKDGEPVSKSQFDSETLGMTYKEQRSNGYQKQSALKLYRVFPLEKIKHLLPKWFIDERPYFKEQEELEKQVMSPEMQDEQFVEKAQFLIEAMGVPVIEKNEDRAYYSPAKHEIIIPPRNKFSSDKAYFSVILHELSHSTAKQLGRDMSNAFGTAGYSKEELIAETATLFMCLNEGLETFNSHARYLEGWASHFQDNKKTLLSICKQAKEAQQYIADKVTAHKSNLANMLAYKAPKKLDMHAEYNEKHSQELREFINIQAQSYGAMIPLKNQEIVGLNRNLRGIEIFTQHKSVKLYGPIAQTMENKLCELELKQELYNSNELDKPLLEPKPTVIKPSNRLLM